MGTGTEGKSERNKEADLKEIYNIINHNFKFLKEYITLDLSSDKTWDNASDRVNAEVKSVDIFFQDYAADMFNLSLSMLNQLRKEYY